MAATAPYSETVIAAVMTAMEGISLQSDDNTTVRRVRRYDPYRDWDKDSTTDRPLIEVEHAGEEKEEEGAGPSEWLVVLNLRLWCLLDRDLTPGGSLDERLNLFGHDVEQALQPIAEAQNVQLVNMERTPLQVLQPNEPTHPGFQLSARFSYTVDRLDLSQHVSP